MPLFPPRPAIALVALSALSACTGNPDILLGGGVTMDEAADKEAALINRVDNVLLAEGETDITELPLSGGATYNGIIHGFDSTDPGDTGPLLEYFADLRLTADFSDDTISGSVRNMVTDLPGFGSPSGSATVTGNIVDDGGLAGLNFEADGSFSQGSNTATYFASSNDGLFVGDTPKAAYGDHITTFTWTSGGFIGTQTFADGDWNVED